MIPDLENSGYIPKNKVPARFYMKVSQNISEISSLNLKIVDFIIDNIWMILMVFLGIPGIPHGFKIFGTKKWIQKRVLKLKYVMNFHPSSYFVDFTDISD